MPFKQIDTVLSWAKPIKARFLRHTSRTQYGKSRGARIRKVFGLPNVHLGIDRIFFKNGEIPGSKIGRLLQTI
jgi:hypothetical protein